MRALPALVATVVLASDWAMLGGREKRGIRFHPRARSQRAPRRADSGGMHTWGCASIADGCYFGSRSSTSSISSSGGGGSSDINSSSGKNFGSAAAAAVAAAAAAITRQRQQQH